MDDIPLTFAKDHLEELIARARRGEVVTINDGRGRVQLTAPAHGDVIAPRITDTLPPFVPLKQPRLAGRLAGKFSPPPEGFFDPLSDEDLKDWYGEQA